MARAGAFVSICFFGLVFHANIASGQVYPSRTVRFFSSEVGGATDTIARLIASRLSDQWGRPVIVENRNVTIGGQMVAHSSPDGYTVLITGSTLWISPLFERMPFDPLKDFAPVTMVSNEPVLILVKPTLPVRSVRDLIAMAKTKPGQLNYGTASTGSAGYLAAEFMKSMARIDMVRIQYKGAAESLDALLGGEVQLSFASAPSAMPLVKSGALKALAVTSVQPSEVAPGVPTMASAGFVGYEVGSQIGMFVAAKTPTTIVHQLNRDVVRVLAMPDVKEKLLNLGTEIVADSPEQFAAVMNSQTIRVRKLVKNEGLRVDK
jgi:tripartite-type tricarboxylate transporter receptor subunit TctC